MSSLPNFERYGQLFVMFLSILVAVESVTNDKQGTKISVCTNIEHKTLIIRNRVRPSFSRAEYERLQLGMPLAEVESILGRGTEIKKTATMVIFVWKNHDGSKITVNFEIGRLKSKEHCGLN